MPTITLDDGLWTQLRDRARKSRRAPNELAAEAVEAHLSLLDDEDLLAESARQAVNTAVDIEDTEELVRQYRRGD